VKYKAKEYENCEFYGFNGSEGIASYKSKVVKCKTEHLCSHCNKKIKKGDHALREIGFMDGNPVQSYTCIPCLDAWIEETLPEQRGEFNE